jgi:hypothetical protein
MAITYPNKWWYTHMSEEQLLSAEAPEASVENEAISPETLPEESKEAKEVEALEEKKASGEKLTKKEEKQLKEYKLKVNGKEKVVKFDPSNDEEVVKYLQKAEASDSKFQEAAEVRKAAMQFIDELRKNPRKVLTDPNIAVDLKKLAQEIMNEEIQEMEKTPEQREKEKLQRELEEIKKQREEEKKTWEQKEFERLQAQHEQQLESDISSALDIGGLPKTARTVKAMAEMMMIALENGIDLTPKDIVPIVKNTTLSEFKEVVNSLSDDQLEDFLGKEVIGRLRKRSVAKAKAAVQTASSVKPTGSEPKKSELKQPEKKMTIRDFLKV